MSKFEIRPATAVDFRAFYGRDPDVTIKALVGLLDGEPVGFGGYYLVDGAAVAFSDMKPEMRGRRKDIVRGARAIMDLIRRSGLATTAGANPAQPNAPLVLTRYGFRHIHGAIWYYDPQGQDHA